MFSALPHLTHSTNAHVCSSIKKVRAGTVLVKQGELSSKLFLIHHGEVRLFSQGHTGHGHHREQWTLELLPALYSHDCFGMPLVDPRKLKKVGDIIGLAWFRHPRHLPTIITHPPTHPPTNPRTY